jgi:FKBP-type peptidyl-prolyl cis-trans isomerase
MRVFVLTIMMLSGLLLVSCNNNKPSGYVAKKPKEVQKSPEKSLEKVNRYLLKVENQEIDDYVRRHHWNMETTGSGLRYQIVKHGKGRAIKQGDRVALKYNTFLINGRMIYSSVKLGPKVFEVGHGGVETGLEEAVMHLHKGDKANVIIPSFLAYGLNGDDDKIPPRAIVIYTIEVLDVN